MSTEYLTGLDRLLASGAAACLPHSLRGIEKESLRVDAQGVLSQHPHPSGLGAALTHPCITTDYSEALLELISPPCDNLDDMLAFLTDLHRYVFRHLDDELLWVNSMPCLLRSEASIPIANYGHSFLGQLKYVYRNGLAYRYGKAMQTISGVHFNYSFTDAFWHRLLEYDATCDFGGRLTELQAVKNTGYFSIIRNFLRLNWWLVLVFGASPAVCNSFFQGRSHQLTIQDNHTAFGRFATSLRMGDLGYQNSRQKDLFICHDSVENYARSLQQAMRMPDKHFAEIGLKVGDEYRQLSTNVLQIENEYYGSIRPKRSVSGLMRPSDALLNQGVEYLEVRLLDLNPFEPIGVSREQLQTIEVLLVYCLLKDSPLMRKAEYHETRKRLNHVVNYGRDPHGVLCFDGKEDRLQAHALRILDDLKVVAEAVGISDWAITEKQLRCRLEDFEQLPSARILSELRESELAFFDWGMQQARKTAGTFRQSTIDPLRCQQFDAISSDSVRAQEQLERECTESGQDFDHFLASYMADSVHGMFSA